MVIWQGEQDTTVPVTAEKFQENEVGLTNWFRGIWNLDISLPFADNLKIPLESDRLYKAPFLLATANSLPY